MNKTWPVWIGGALGLAAIAFAFATQAGLVDQWHEAAHYTARVGFPLLILAYVARPLVELTRSKWAKYILARRKYFGLGFAVAHTIHLAALITAIEVSGEGKDVLTYVFGGAAYTILYVMAFTSNAAAMKAMGVWWKRVHRSGIHYLWFIFFQSYAGRMADPEQAAVAIPFTIIALAAAAVRFTAWWKARQHKRATKAS
uniref:hypothetical protein n=1 Tax=uncultured Altererythrobacter sp. TaxID=500840 RepID=UPI00260ABD69|nr:hypothetical protein [uncultured Altererythrobacter sp.]